MPAWHILSSGCIYSREVMEVRALGIVFCILLLAGLLLFPQAAAQGALAGLRTCGASLIPALLPCFVLTRLLASQLRLTRAVRRLDTPMRVLFGVEGGCFAALLLSFLGGYPAGVGAVTALYQKGGISKQSAERAVCFCNNSGPAFFLGVAGSTILHSARAGLLLYGIHILSALCAGILLAQPMSKAAVRKTKALDGQQPFFTAFLDAVAASCAALLQISGLVVFFSALTALVGKAGTLPQAGILTGMLELTSGILQLEGSWELRFLACAFLLSWGGLCVHFQAAAIWTSAGLHPKGYWLEKALHAALSVLFACAALSPTPLFLGSAGAILLLCVLFPLFRKKKAGNLRHAVV